MFERFYRIVGNESEGSGLGLSIVQEIARACQASVRLDEGRNDRGLVVSVTFPQAQAPAPVATVSSAPAPSVHRPAPA